MEAGRTPEDVDDTDPSFPTDGGSGRLLVAFNVAAIAWFSVTVDLFQTVDFALWFAADLVIGLVALALTESP